MEVKPKYSKKFIMNACRKGISPEQHSAEMIVKFLKMKGYSKVKYLHIVTASPEGRTEEYLITGYDR